MQEPSAMDDEYYWLYVYKVAECPVKERHDWSKCPYAHRGERAARRCPRIYGYSADPCPEYCKKGVCIQRERCPMAHSVFESWLHPSKFRTQLCCFGSSCSRRICFFAHNASQLRLAAPSTMNPTGTVLRRTQTIVSVHQNPHEAAAAVAGITPGVMPAAAQASIPTLQMQGYPGPVPTAAGVGAPALGTVAGQFPAASNWATTATPTVEGQYVGPAGVNVAGLTANLQGLNLHQDPAMSAMVLQQQSVDPVGPAGVDLSMVAGQSSAYVPGMHPGLAGMSGVSLAMQMPGGALAMGTPGGAGSAGMSVAGQPVGMTGSTPLQYYYVQPDMMGPQ